MTEDEIEAIRQAKIAALTPAQRFARYWAWFGDITLVCTGLVVVYVVVMWWLFA